MARNGYRLGSRLADYTTEISMKNSVKQLREQRNLSQAELGQQLGVSRQTIYAIEVGKYDPSLPLAFKIAKTFRKSIEEMFDPEE
jgi:putative transcriptional regulator